MHLTRCQDQNPQTLDEFYEEALRADGYTLREGSRAMLDLIARLRALPVDLRVFGLTSHHRLCLLAEDTYQSSWFVIICALDHRNYCVEYLMPARFAPWLGAYVRGEARSVNEACKMVITAMQKSEGWAGSSFGAA